MAGGGLLQPPYTSVVGLTNWAFANRDYIDGRSRWEQRPDPFACGDLRAFLNIIFAIIIEDLGVMVNRHEARKELEKAFAEQAALRDPLKYEVTPEAQRGNMDAMQFGQEL